MTQNTIDPRIQQALQVVAGSDEDRARVQNSVGFSKSDGELGHVLANTPVERWSPRMAAAAYKMALRYRRQALEGGVDVSDITEPVVTTPRTPRVATISAYRSGLAFHSERTDPAVDVVRSAPQRRYLGAPDYCWVLPATRDNLPTLRTLYSQGVSFDAAAIERLRALGRS